MKSIIFFPALYLALGIFFIGLIYRVYLWFTLTLGPDSEKAVAAKRIKACIRGTLRIVFSRKVIVLLKSIFIDVLFQRRLLAGSSYRWIAHMLVFWGFSYLLLMHALEALILPRFVPDYASTQNPYLFLRNLAGLAVLIGLVMMISRKKIRSEQFVKKKAADKMILILLGTMLISGFALEALKITSKSRFQEMVQEYSDDDDPESLVALETYWVKYYGLVSDRSLEGNSSNLLERGKELHEMSCASCHARPQWAFLSFGLAKTITHAASSVDRAGGPTYLWFLHFLTAFFALAMFPFTKLFHLLASPLSLLVNSVMDDAYSDPTNVATRQAMELDACTHCGLCTQVCAIAVAVYNIPNLNILPSEKISHLKSVANKNHLSTAEVSQLLEGLYLCTNCHRCTDVCPSGINLQNMWFRVREAYLTKGVPEPLTLTPFSFFRGLKQDGIPDSIFQVPVSKTREAIEASCASPGIEGNTVILKSLDQKGKLSLLNSERGRSLSYCYTCTTCSSACPVARAVENAPGTLGLLPHQIIRAANLGVTDMVFRSEMLWSCLSCYMCQDACPQGVRVADIISELKIMATEQVKQFISNGGKELL